MSFLDQEQVHREDCQVCYNTIELRYQVNNDRDLVSFRAQTARPLHDPFESDWFT